MHWIMYLCNATSASQDKTFVTTDYPWYLDPCIIPTIYDPFFLNIRNISFPVSSILIIPSLPRFYLDLKIVLFF